MMQNSENFYINSQSQLNRVVDLIKETKLVALDTEFTRETTYYPILSIVQVALKKTAQPQQLFIIDCLADLDLSQFFALIAEEKISKVLHSSAQDLQIFHHKSDLMPQGVFDTQVMANFCGFDFSAGYSNLVEKLFSTVLDKKQQRSDWQIRPLSTKQIDYALLDVIFLEEIYHKFLEILKAKNRTEWYLEEMQNFISKNLSKPEEALSKHFSFKHKSARQISQTKSLILWRERWAKKINIPRQHLIKDEAIEDLVTGRKINFSFGAEMILEMKKILEETEENFDKNLEEKPAQEIDSFMSAKQKNAYLEAKKLIGTISLQENFKEQFLVTSYDLKKVICAPKLFNQTIRGWRYQLFGKQLEQLL